MFFTTATLIFWVYAAVALLPAIYLLIYIYRLDRIEPEPVSLIIRLLISGALAGIASGFLEGIGTGLFNLVIDPSLPAYTALFAFLVVGVIEEGTKLIAFMSQAWKHPAFDYRFDAIVYAVSASIGFAALENIMYVLQFGLVTGFARAFTSIPAHVAFAVLAGMFFGRAKEAQRRGDVFGCRCYLIIGYLLAVFLHGFFDTAAMTGNMFGITALIVAILIIYFVIIKVVRKEAAKDHRI